MKSTDHIKVWLSLSNFHQQNLSIDSMSQNLHSFSASRSNRHDWQIESIYIKSKCKATIFHTVLSLIWHFFEGINMGSHITIFTATFPKLESQLKIWQAKSKCQISLLGDWILFRAMLPFISDWLTGTLEHLLFKSPLQKRPKWWERKTFCHTLRSEVDFLKIKKEGSCDMTLLNSPGFSRMWLHCSQQHHHQHSSALLLFIVLSYLTTGNHRQQYKELLIFKRHCQKLELVLSFIHLFNCTMLIRYN